MKKNKISENKKLFLIRIFILSLIIIIIFAINLYLNQQSSFLIIENVCNEERINIPENTEIFFEYDNFKSGFGKGFFVNISSSLGNPNYFYYTTSCTDEPREEIKIKRTSYQNRKLSDSLENTQSYLENLCINEFNGTFDYNSILWFCHFDDIISTSDLTTEWLDNFGMSECVEYENQNEYEYFVRKCIRASPQGVDCEEFSQNVVNNLENDCSQWKIGNYTITKER